MQNIKYSWSINAADNFDLRLGIFIGNSNCAKKSALFLNKLSVNPCKENFCWYIFIEQDTDLLLLCTSLLLFLIVFVDAWKYQLRSYAGGLVQTATWCKIIKTIIISNILLYICQNSPELALETFGCRRACAWYWLY